MTGHVRLIGVEGFGHHGVFEHERVGGQRFVVDVDCVVDLDTAADSDNLQDTLDYGTLAAEIVADIEGPPLNLIEALAGRVAATCLAHDEVLEATVTVHKPQAPVPVPVADVMVTVQRRKP